jgi:RNA polymerase sigma factor (sigma-70 family)
MADESAVVALVARAATGDQDAWNELVERYAPLVWSICTRYHLCSQDVEDVGQTVWLKLVEQLGKLREPAALPGWLATTTARECVRVLRGVRRQDDLSPSPDERLAPEDAEIVEQEIITAERNAAVRKAFAGLPAHCRQLLSMLISDPPLSYREISTILEIPIGSIGPQRQRCLRRLRECAALADFLDGGPEATTAEVG